MPILDKLKKFKNNPVAIIYRGASALGIKLTDLLLEQGAFVIIIDEYNQKNKQHVKDYANNKKFSFVDISGAISLADSIEKVDYIFHFNHNVCEPDDEVSTSKFLEESNTLDRLLQLAVEKKSKFLLTSSIRIHQLLEAKKQMTMSGMKDDESISYTGLELERYGENLTWEYYRGGGVDMRIIRLGELLGEGVDLERNTTAFEFIKSAVKGEKINIKGDGLEHLYFVHIIDAAYGLVKALFTEDTSGKVFSLMIPRDITALNVAYKILDLAPHAEGMEFIEEDDTTSAAQIYKPAKNLDSIGWKPKVSFERALAQTIDFAYGVFGKRGKVKKGAQEALAEIEKSEEDVVPRPEKKKKRSLKDLIIDFFFEIEEEKKKESVLDNVQYATVQGEDANLKGIQGLQKRRKSFLTSKKKIEKRDNIATRFTSALVRFKRRISSITLPMFVLYVFVFILLFGIYIAIIVPGVRIAYNLQIARMSISASNKALDKNEFSSAANHLQKAQGSFSALEDDMENLDYVTIIAGKKTWTDIKISVRHSAGLAGEGKKICEYFAPIELYLNNESANSASMIKLLDLNDNSLYNVSSPPQFSSIGISFVDSYFSGLNGNLLSVHSSLSEMSDLASVIPSFASIGKESSIVFLFLDESDKTSQGGKIYSAGTVTIKNAQITQVEAYDLDRLPLKFSNEQRQLVLDNIEGLKRDDEVGMEDLSRISDDSLFLSSIKSVFEKKPQDNVFIVLTVNTAGLENLLSLYGGITLDSSDIINSSNLGKNLNDKDFNMHGFSGSLLERIANFKKEDLSMLSAFIENNLKSGNVVLYTYDQKIKDFLLNKKLQGDSASV